VKKKPDTKISQKDKKDWEEFIRSPDSIEDKDSKNKSKLISSSRLYERKLDLHGMTLNESFLLVSKIIHDSVEKKKRRILIITGKGLHSNTEDDPYRSKNMSLLKYAIPDFIKEKFSNYLHSIEEAPIEHGGSGAMIVVLKKL
jgi:DNA-nicking Smr family endonuclease